MAKNIMTQRAFFNAIITGTLTLTIDEEEVKSPLINEDGTINEAVRNFAVSRLAKLDADAEARKAKPSKAQTENRTVAEDFVKTMAADHIYTAAEIGNLLGVSASKATNLMKAVPDLVAQVETKIKPEEGRARVVKGYTLITPEG